MSDRNFRKVSIEEIGEPEVMRYTKAELTKPKYNEVVIQHKAIGLNFIDIYYRKGIYPISLPSGLGMEASGIILEVGKNVTHLTPGDRVAYAATPLGAYCEARNISAEQVCKLPDSITFDQGAAAMLKGFTVQYLFNNTTPISRGDTVLFHAAAGGVGLIACQWAKSEGITLIGTVGTEEKGKLALEHGATHVVNYRSENFVQRCHEITGGKGVDVVMDAIGRDTFEQSLDCLKPLGMMISFGNTSGKVPPVDIGLLQAKGSLKLTRPTLFNPHLSTRKRCETMSRILFDKILSKQVKIKIGQKFNFENIVEAHTKLEQGKTVGSTVITV